jgi:hypothetical protein
VFEFQLHEKDANTKIAHQRFWQPIPQDLMFQNDSMTALLRNYVFTHIIMKRHLPQNYTIPKILKQNCMVIKSSIQWNSLWSVKRVIYIQKSK